MMPWAPIAFSVLATVWMIAASVIETSLENKTFARQQKLKHMRQLEDELGLQPYPFGPLGSGWPEN